MLKYEKLIAFSGSAADHGFWAGRVALIALLPVNSQTDPARKESDDTKRQKD